MFQTMYRLVILIRTGFRAAFLRLLALPAFAGDASGQIVGTEALRARIFARRLKTAGGVLAVALGED